MVTVRNNLVAPITARADGVPAFSIAAGDQLDIRLPSRNIDSFEWEIGSAPAGTLASGSAWIDLPSTTAFMGTASIEPPTKDGRYFAPLITNETTSPLCLIIDDVIRSNDRDCDVSIPPGVERRFVGYRRLTDESYVRGVRPDGVGTTYRDITASVNQRSGAIILKFAPDHFTR